MNSSFPPRIQAAILLRLVIKVKVGDVGRFDGTHHDGLGVISPKEVGEKLCDQNQERDEWDTDRLFNMGYGTRREPHRCPRIQVRCDRYTK